MRVLLVLAALFLLTPPLSAWLDRPQTRADFYPDGSPKSVHSTRRTLEGDLVNDGPFTTCHPNGQVESRGSFENGVRQGRWEWYHESGQLQAECEYEDGRGRFRSFTPGGRPLREGIYEGNLRQGIWTEWWENGQLRMRGEFVDDQQHGPWTYWDEQDSTRSMRVIWDHGKRVN